MKRTLWIMAGLIAVLIVVAGFSLRDFFNPSARLDPQEARFTEQEVDRHTAALVEKFEYSRATPLFQGDTFPRLPFPVLRGNEPSWSQAAVVTVGGTASSSALELYTRLSGTELPKIHVVTDGPLVPQELEAFPAEVTLLDGTGGTDGLNIGQELHDLLGIAGTSGYLVGADQTVLFAQVNKGDFTNLGAAVEDLVQRGPEAVVPSTQQLLPIEEPLPLAEVPTEFRDELDAVLSKPVTLVFLSDKTWCDTCEDWLGNADAFIESWRERGYGLILVEGGSEQVALETLPNGVVRLSDVHLPGSETESQVLSSWGMTGIPATFVLKDGALQGQVSWLEVEIDGTPYRDLHFRALEQVVQTVGAALVKHWNTAFRHRAHVLEAYSILKVEG